MAADYTVKRVYRNDPSDSASLSSNLVTCVIQDRDGIVWAGTSAGLNRLIDGTAHFRRYTAGQGGLKSEYILSLLEDSEHNIWIGTYGGTSVLNEDRDFARHFLQDPAKPDAISSNYVLSFCEDENGTLWIGTGGGLNRFNRKTGTFTHFLGRHGLPNAVVTGILDAGDGVLWISTHFGISRFDGSTGTFSNYDTRDDISCNMFMPGTACRTSDGHMVFGGNGITFFNPSSIMVSTFSPRIEITDFVIVGNDTRPGRVVRSGDTLDLSYDQNYFRVEFSALDFLRPSRALYSYKLEGVDQLWVKAGTARTASYSSLAPGSYQLRIRGTNGDGVWSTQEATVNLEIRPPVWKTWWFVSITIALVGASLYVGHLTRLRNKLDRSKELDRARHDAAEAIRKKAARDFHDELGHRLTKIGLFAELVRKRIEHSSPEATTHLAKIIESAQGLTDETRNFLWSLDPGQDSLHDLVEYLNEFGEELFERTGIIFRPAESSEAMREFRLTMDFRRHVALILKEAMHNALKHSGCSNISLSVRLNDGDLFLSLTDDGKGCVPASNGKGNGMKNMRMRAEQIRGAVEIESRPGLGTRVVFASSVA
jgi:signal transduction histidine kinase